MIGANIFQLPPIDSIAKQLHLQLVFYGKFYNVRLVTVTDDKFREREHFQWTSDTTTHVRAYFWCFDKNNLAPAASVLPSYQPYDLLRSTCWSHFSAAKTDFFSESFRRVFDLT